MASRKDKVSGLNNLEYRPGDGWRPEEVPAGRYRDSPGPRMGTRQRGAGQPARANVPPMRGQYPHQPANGSRPRSNSGPMPAYPPANGRPYPPPNRRVPSSGPMPVYVPPTGRPANGYQPYDSGPMPAYPPANGRPAKGYPSNGYLLVDSGPMPAYSPGVGTTRVYPSRPGRSLLSWMPFGQRLVLLPKDLGEEEVGERRDVNGGWLRPAVFGAMDGLVTNSSLIAGIGGGGGGHAAIVLTGIAGLIAGAFSMATGEYISVKSQNELTLAEVAREREQLSRDPEGKRKRLTDAYIKKGVSPNLAEAVVRQISANPERAVEEHVREELGIDPDDLPSPQTAAVASFASFTVGALLPLSPFLLGLPDLTVALVVAGAAAFAGGAAVAKLTGRSMLLGGMRQFGAAFLGTGAAFVLGHLIGGHLG
jgi:VIT1/CCC1 family predicted Fe2+/Mn2+ transporter